MDQIGKLMETDKVQIPDLGWLDIDASDIENIPSSFNVQIVPELEQAWAHPQQRSANLIPNNIATTKKASETHKEAAQDLVRMAKREMMTGLTGKALATKLAASFLPEVIQAAKDELTKLSSEQGLLGNVYVDMSAFDSCAEAARYLGKNRVRTAKFVVGNPIRHACSTHCDGQCRDLGKKVVASMEYSQEVLSDYGKHLHIAGVVGNVADIDSKDALREAFLAKPEKVANTEVPKKSAPVDKKVASVNLAAELEKSASERAKVARQQRFQKVRPILAFMQEQMLKGKIGDALKESLLSKYSSNEIKEYAPEIRRVAGLQGLLGNVYVDLSYFKNADEAIRAIKAASTNPLYLVQTVKENAFDGIMAKVAQATGCTEFPKNGKIDQKVALSYITDLQFSDRISSEKAQDLRSSIDAGQNVLAVIRDTFLATQGHKKQVREGGVKMHFSQGVSKKATDRDSLKRNAYRALEAGISISKLEDKLASVVPTAEALSMSRSVLASLSEVDANCLPKCANERYQLKREARIKKASKCASCIYNSPTACTQQGVKFVGAKDLDKAFFDLDPKTEKVQFDENPDVSRSDMQQEYDMKDSFGSGMNVALEETRKEASIEVDVDFSRDGVDNNLSTL